jgi:hypothetical protein
LIVLVSFLHEREKIMIEPQPVPQKKNRTWIWIVVVVVVLCLCCLVALLAVGGYAVWKGYISLSGINVPNLTAPSVLATPTAIPPSSGPTASAPSSGPATGSTQITVEPYQPLASDNYPTLQSLVSNYQGSSTPSTQNWNAAISANQPALVYMGWCTTTQTILAQNFQHIQYLVEVDGRSINVNNLYTETVQDSTTNGYCKSYIGLVRTWPTGKHTVKITMRMDAQINDGWSDYPAGDYTDVFNINVTP